MHQTHLVLHHVHGIHVLIHLISGAETGSVEILHVVHVTGG